MQPPPQLETRSGEEEFAPIVFGLLQKSLTEYFRLGGMVPSGIRIESVPTRWPE